MQRRCWLWWRRDVHMPGILWRHGMWRLHQYRLSVQRFFFRLFGAFKSCFLATDDTGITNGVSMTYCEQVCDEEGRCEDLEKTCLYSCYGYSCDFWVDFSGYTCDFLGTLYFIRSTMTHSHILNSRGCFAMRLWRLRYLWAVMRRRYLFWYNLRWSYCGIRIYLRWIRRYPLSCLFLHK